MSMEKLEHLHLPLAVHVQLGVLSMDTHQDTRARLLERAHVAARQSIGDTFCEYLGWVMRERMKRVKGEVAGEGQDLLHGGSEEQKRWEST